MSKTSDTVEKYDYLIIGGGIAGITCAQRLSSLVESSGKILLLSASPLIKAATNIKTITKFVQDFEVEEKPIDDFLAQHKNMTILNKHIAELDSKNHKVSTTDGCTFEYKKLCICTGGYPKVISQNEYVIGIRDTETVLTLQKRLQNARQIVIVGNGGIAIELVYEIENCNIIWAIKDDSIGHVFFDSATAKFFLNKLHKKEKEEPIPAKRTKYTITRLGPENPKSVVGSALGPDWSLGLSMKGSTSDSHSVTVEYKCEIKSIITREEFLKLDENERKQLINGSNEWPVYVRLTNGKLYGCDFIISATGVTPNADIFCKNNDFKLSNDGAILVDDHMRTNIDDVYAAGDICSVNWQTAPHWFQMKLWSQARQMGDYAARCMFSSLNSMEIELDFCFELFAHITKFFNYKVILLGKYNAQGLGNDYELLLRSTPEVEYIKIVLQNGRVTGAILIGETDLEETFENLILNQIDVSSLGEDLLNPDVEIDDYFD